MITITENERALLIAILNSEYNGADGTDRIGNPVWVNCLNGFSNKTKFGGVMASASKKGLAATDGETCWITAEGYEAIDGGAQPLPEGYVPMPTAQNRIVEVRLVLAAPGGEWQVQVRKEFAPEHGGGEQWFTEWAGPEIHRALDVAKGMVTASAGHRTDTPEQIAAQARLAAGRRAAKARREGGA
jgi:hypothetical protein